MTLLRYLRNHPGYIAGVLIVAACAYTAARESLNTLSWVLSGAVVAMCAIMVCNWYDKFKGQ